MEQTVNASPSPDVPAPARHTEHARHAGLGVLGAILSGTFLTTFFTGIHAAYSAIRYNFVELHVYGRNGSKEESIPVFDAMIKEWRQKRGEIRRAYQGPEYLEKYTEAARQHSGNITKAIDEVYKIEGNALTKFCKRTWVMLTHSHRTTQQNAFIGALGAGAITVGAGGLMKLAYNSNRRMGELMDHIEDQEAMLSGTQKPTAANDNVKHGPIAAATAPAHLDNGNTPTHHADGVEAQGTLAPKQAGLEV